MSGRGPRLFSLPPRIGALPVGSTIKLNVASTPWEFLIVHQGLPSDLYDASCDGAWLLMKDLYNMPEWSISNKNVYETSTIDTWLNGDFRGLLDSGVQSVIKQVKIPYRKNGGGSNGTDQSGADGLLRKIFLLSAYEVGFTADDSKYLPTDGAKLSYFTTDNSRRIAYLSGTATRWWLRSPITTYTDMVALIMATGRLAITYNAAVLAGTRPAFIMPSDFRVTDDMLSA